MKEAAKTSSTFKMNGEEIMCTAAIVIREDDPILESDFMKEIDKQIQMLNSRGGDDTWSVTRILSPFLSTGEGDIDESVPSRLGAFYNAIASLIEKECGLTAKPIIDLSHEGRGRAVITTGKLVVMDRTLCDVQRFGFPSLSKMKDEADKILSVALEIIGKNPEVAGMQ